MSTRVRYQPWFNVGRPQARVYDLVADRAMKPFPPIPDWIPPVPWFEVECYRVELKWTKNPTEPPKAVRWSKR